MEPLKSPSHLLDTEEGELEEMNSRSLDLLLKRLCSHKGPCSLASCRSWNCLLMLRGLLWLELGGTTHGLERLCSLWGLFHSLKGRFLLSACGLGLGQLLSGSCHGLFALLQGKILSRILETGYYWLSLPSKSQLLKKEADLRPPFPDP